MESGLQKQGEEEEVNENTGSSSGRGVGGEMEHMFDKVVTPSDVGKLNRLVIPKQHAEKYFPLDSSANEKGLLLNFEDGCGKLWRFRYSYWSSSQSYVMTKGWSRFVKEKKLDAGDVVSFHRGLGELTKDRLYIDWRHRPHHLPDDLQLPFSQSVPLGWGTIYSHQLPSMSMSMSMRQYHDHLQHNYIWYDQRMGCNSSVQGYNPMTIRPSLPCSNIRSLAPHKMGAYLQVQKGANVNQMAISSMPAAPKRLRLFGVNMECSTTDDESHSHEQCVATEAHSQRHHFWPSLHPSQLKIYEGAPVMAHPSQFVAKEPNSLSFDLDH